ncbi:hypothetical protein ACIQZB_12215 [Streptomyces sp. NPDC097727]|uniref:hypothetical protein n=1 Tax=Streptomyces sp. NPDC097727 TaxID=3366092 RepID=UPI0038307D75
MGTRRRGTALLCAVVVMSGVAGCGGSDGKSGGGEPSGAATVSNAQRMSASLKLLKDYRSLGLKGEFRGDMIRKVDLHADRQGNCVGTYAESDSTTKVVITGGRGWLAYDDRGLESIRSFAQSYMPDKVAAVEEAVKKARGKYVEYPVHDVLQFPGVNLCALDRAFAGVPGKVGSAERGNPRTEVGERLVSLTHAFEDGEVVVHVPEKGEPVPRGVEFEIDDNPVLLELDDYDEPVNVKPPGPADIVQEKEVRGLDLSLG